jgi:hypothetical protein
VSELPVTRAQLVPVPDGPRGLVRRERSVPAALLPAVAAGSFAAGAAAVGLVRRRATRAPRAVGLLGGRRRALRRGGSRGERLHIIGTRTLLLDVHLVGRPGK